MGAQVVGRRVHRRPVWLPLAIGLALAGDPGLGHTAGAVRVPTAAESLSPAADIGRQMFFDRSLSASGKVSCATCHDPRHAYAPSNGLAVQPGGATMTAAGTRAVPSLRYQEFTPPYERSCSTIRTASARQDPEAGFTHDGRAATLAEQAEIPLLSPNEMANARRADVVERMAAAAVRGSIQAGVRRRASSATARRRFCEPPRRFRRFNWRTSVSIRTAASTTCTRATRRGGTLSPAERRGFVVYNDPAKGNCFACHYNGAGMNGSVRLFTDFTYAALGVPRNPDIPANRDPGYFDLGICGRPDHPLPASAPYCGMFKTPTLRNTATRRVFFHNGQLKSLRDVIRFYNTRDTAPEDWYPIVNGVVQKFNDLPLEYRGNLDRQAPLDGRPRGSAPAMSEQDMEDLEAFLKTLTDADQPLTPPARAPGRASGPPTLFPSPQARYFFGG